MNSLLSFLPSDMLDYTDLMETNLQNLRHSLTGLSLDEFIVRTLEGLMQVERKEYLLKAQDGKEKGNGYYSRAFKSLRRNAMTVSIPRTRCGGFSPLTLELVRKNGEDIDDLCLTLTRKGMTCRDIADVLETFFQEKKSHTSINNLATDCPAWKGSSTGCSRRRSSRSASSTRSGRSS